MADEKSNNGSERPDPQGEGSLPTQPSQKSSAVAVSQRAPPSLGPEAETESSDDYDEEDDTPALWQRIAIWVIAIAIGLLFVALGVMKLIEPSMFRSNFQGWGYAAWFVYVVGLLELSGGAMMLVPKLRFWGAALIWVDMLGAIYTHLRHGPLALIVANIMFITFAGIAAWFSLPEFIERRLPERKDEGPPIF